MEITTETVLCPQCGRPAQVTLFRHLDERGVATGHELEFVCPHGHRVQPDDVVRLWARDHALG